MENAVLPGLTTAEVIISWCANFTENLEISAELSERRNNFLLRCAAKAQWRLYHRTCAVRAVCSAAYRRIFHFSWMFFSVCFIHWQLWLKVLYAVWFFFNFFEVFLQNFQRYSSWKSRWEKNALLPMLKVHFRTLVAPYRLVKVFLLPPIRLLLCP